MVMERWLPVLGVALGLSLMAVAVVAEGQPVPGQGAAQAMPPMAGAGHDGGDPPSPHRGWDRHRRGGGFSAMAPEQFCKEGFAREAGFLAYTGAKLELTAAQQPLWDKYRQAMLDSGAKQRQVCLDATSASPSGVTALERRDRMEKILTARLDALHATRPALEALYQAMSPEQRALLDHPRWRGPGR